MVEQINFMEVCQLNVFLKGKIFELWLFCESKLIFKVFLWFLWMLNKIFYKSMLEVNDGDLEI